MKVNKKLRRVHLLLSETEFEIIKALAEQYCSGNISAYFRMRALNTFQFPTKRKP